MENSMLMPAEGFAKLKTVQLVTGLSRSTILRRIEDGRFPKPIKYGHILLFPVEAIREFINSLKGQ